MKHIWLFVLFCSSLVVYAQRPVLKNGRVSGKVTDAQGKPMSNVKLVIENTVFYASYVYAMTNAAGHYSASLPPGSWKVSATIEKSLEGRIYRFDLHPDNAEAFAGTVGAVRNFTWKLNGAKPGHSGFYGSSVAVYSEPGSSVMMDDVEIMLSPAGLLIDGNKGKLITSMLTDIGGGEDGIKDVPIAKYLITARSKSTGKTLQVRLRNKGIYSDSLMAIFDSGFTGITGYSVTIQVQEKNAM